MTTKSQFRLKGKSRDSYLELVRDFPLASIKSDEHLAEAQRVSTNCSRELRWMTARQLISMRSATSSGLTKTNTTPSNRRRTPTCSNI